MGKGSGRRPGKGYEENWERIFGQKKGPTPQKDAEPLSGGTKPPAGRTDEKL